MIRMFKVILVSVALAAYALTVAALAGAFDFEILEVTTLSNSTTKVTDTTTKIYGTIHYIGIDVQTTGVTGDCSVAFSPYLDEMDDVEMATILVVEEKTFRPLVDATDIAGDALTGDPPVRYQLNGETVTFAVTNASASNTQFRAIVKYKKQ